jgi:hypothetical protein
MQWWWWWLCVWCVVRVVDYGVVWAEVSGRAGKSRVTEGYVQGEGVGGGAWATPGQCTNVQPPQGLQIQSQGLPPPRRDVLVAQGGGIATAAISRSTSPPALQVMQVTCLSPPSPPPARLLTDSAASRH